MVGRAGTAAVKRWLRRAAFFIGSRVLAGLEAIKDEIVERRPEVEPHDETESWPVPAQDPLTPASRAMLHRPSPRRSTAAPPARPLAGSRAARVRAARGSE